MAIDPINIGTSANDGNGDPLRTAFGKINENESDLDTRVDAAQATADAAQSAADDAQATADAAQSAADDAQATADAAVKDINGLTPESDGSVTLDADDVGAIASSEKAVANGVASLDDNGIVPQTQLPPFVLSVNNNEPDSAGDVEISASDVGLGNVDNTSDADKPVSDATQTALDAKATKIIVAQQQIIGRASSGSGEPEAVALGAGLEISSGYLELSPRILFCAHKNGVNQNIANNVETDISFASSTVNVGNFYDTSTGRWTPPAGVVRLECTIRFSAGLASSGYTTLAINKKGTNIFIIVHESLKNFETMSLSCITAASGTDYFSVSVTAPSTAGATLQGASTVSAFSGEML